MHGVFKQSKKVGMFGMAKKKVPAWPGINESTQDVHAINPNITNDTII